MIKAYSQRLLPPYSGQVQIAESERARALTIDGKNWEIQFLHAINGGDCHNKPHSDQNVRYSYRRAAYISHSEIHQRTATSPQQDRQEHDERIIELTDFLSKANLPFPATDHYEYWLLDGETQSPLALIYSCTTAEQMENFPSRPEWTALPAAVMPIKATPDEVQRASAPVNYQLERLVAQRAGHYPRASWFHRHTETMLFPNLLLTEDWQDEHQHQLYERYIKRQAPRLLMLHGLQHAERQRLEMMARDHALEVERFYALYPTIADKDIMDAIRVEARIRSATEDQPPLLKRRDGCLYI